MGRGLLPLLELGSNILEAENREICANKGIFKFDFNRRGGGGIGFATSLE